MYRAVTVCKVENGESTNFWEDKWLSQGRLAVRFPLLYSHAATTEVTVARVAGEGIEPFLVPRLTVGARAELPLLRGLLHQLVLTTMEDRRFSPISGRADELRAGPVYRTTMEATGAARCDFADFVWNNRAPPRVQFFAWLLTQDRLNCRSNLKVKNILDDDICELCGQEAEDCQHLILTCPFATWRALDIDASGCSVQSLWDIPRPATIPLKHYDSFILLLSWNLWKHRNEVIFRSLPPSHDRLWSACKEEAREWRCRWKRDDYAICEAWCVKFSNM